MTADLARMRARYVELRTLFPILPPTLDLRESKDGWSWFRPELSSATTAVIDIASVASMWEFDHEVGHAWEHYAAVRALDLGLGGGPRAQRAYYEERGFTVPFVEALLRGQAQGQRQPDGSIFVPHAWSVKEAIADCFALSVPHSWSDAIAAERITAQGGLFTDAERALQPPLDRAKMLRFFKTWPEVKPVSLDERIVAFWQRVNAKPADAVMTAADLSEWTANVVADVSRMTITVGKFRAMTAEMQAALDKARS